MGLSASQARLLSLTARQSNLEYEGQQINQQRTTLSNESSNYYNSLLEMSVPVPPSTNDYTKIVYTFTIGGNQATVTQALPQNDGIGTTYLINYTTNLSTVGIQENESYKTAAKADIIKGTMSAVAPGGTYDKDSSYYLATMNYLSETDASTFEGDVFVKGGDADTQGNKIIGPNGYEITKDQYDNLGDQQKECTIYKPYTSADVGKTKYAISYAQISNETTFDANKDAARYQFTESATGSDYYAYKASNQKEFTVVDPMYAESFLNAGLNINEYYQYEATSGIRFVKREDVEGNLNTNTRSIPTAAVSTITVVKENTMSGATIEFDAQGRISTVTDEDGHTYTMTATTETDNAAYDDAYNQYEYNQYVYDQKQNEINANIEILQAQDKSLELRLSTLDTQHSAIQTELEAVKKVMSKNIDNSFKTFNA